MIKDKLMRMRLKHPDQISSLRTKMRSTGTFGGLTINHEARLTDGVVVDFALAIANLTLSENVMLVDRRKFLGKVNEAVNRHIETLAKMEPDEREALIEMIIGAQATVSPIDASAPLRAAPPASQAEN